MQSRLIARVRFFLMPLNPQKIRERREKLSLTQAQAATRAKMPPPHWSRIESGERNDPVLSTAERIAKSLECELAEILK